MVLSVKNRMQLEEYVRGDERMNRSPLFPPRIPIHLLRFFPHPRHPPIHQFLVLPFQLLASLLRHIKLQAERYLFVLRLLDQLRFAAEFLVAVAQSALDVGFLAHELGDLCRGSFLLKLEILKRGGEVRDLGL